MSSEKEFNLPLRPGEHGKNKFSDASNEGGQRDDQRGNETKPPLTNYANHPNIKGLPGFDFGVADDEPILQQWYSGLLRNIALPFDNFKNPRSASGMLSVARRLQTVFKNLRQYDTDKSWNFEVSHKKIPGIMFKFTESRVRFLNGNADNSSVPSEFLSFTPLIPSSPPSNPASEKTVSLTPLMKKYQYLISRTENDLLKKKRHLEDDETEGIQHTMKKTRIVDIDEDIEKKTPEEQIRFWKEKSLGHEKELEAKDEKLKGQEEKIKWQDKLIQEMANGMNRTNMETTYSLRHLWFAALPEINRQQRNQSQAEWNESQIQEYFRANGMSSVADAMLGKGDFMGPDKM
ncbi:hypothetical protein CNYM01_12640 [Colletotrichum nymphaeae SA-01]|uniref:Uncharacterized protein n=1 Tax=Colletotrichum nymphaeae SA-01 TaxID=1460502 RepID=A0A135ST67_9PEZI|nr:hypothetical protein CNYM01_12640 [Colletotrichum nymphaeae SA-01]